MLQLLMTGYWNAGIIARLMVIVRDTCRSSTTYMGQMIDLRCITIFGSTNVDVGMFNGYVEGFGGAGGAADDYGVSAMGANGGYGCPIGGGGAGEPMFDDYPNSDSYVRRKLLFRLCNIVEGNLCAIEGVYFYGLHLFVCKMRMDVVREMLSADTGHLEEWLLRLWDEIITLTQNQTHQDDMNEIWLWKEQSEFLL